MFRSLALQKENIKNQDISMAWKCQLCKTVIDTILPEAFLTWSAVDIFTLCSGDWGIVSVYVHSSKGEFRSET